MLRQPYNEKRWISGLLGTFQINAFSSTKICLVFGLLGFMAKTYLDLPLESVNNEAPHHVSYCQKITGVISKQFTHPRAERHLPSSFQQRAFRLPVIIIQADANLSVTAVRTVITVTRIFICWLFLCTYCKEISLLS